MAEMGKKFSKYKWRKIFRKNSFSKYLFKKFNGIKLNSNSINNDDFKRIKIFENIILEDLNENVDEKLIYSLLNVIELDNKYIIITSLDPIVDINFSLIDLKSRAKSFLLQNIEKPDDELMFALILKNLSDRQILIDKKLINFIIKRIERSYRNIFDFIYKLDELSLKKKKSIDFKIIKEVLENN